MLNKWWLIANVEDSRFDIGYKAEGEFKTVCYTTDFRLAERVVIGLNGKSGDSFEPFNLDRLKLKIDSLTGKIINKHG